MTVGIIEIIRRSDQGTTRPFLCRAENGHLYYVKGRYAGRKALCAEWIAGRLGRLLGLPIPEIAIAEVPDALVGFSAIEDIADLGTGPAFASLAVAGAQELTYGDIPRVPENLRLQVLVFDWWVHNEDRTLTEYGGNPNLIWSVQQGGLQVFDQNLAFDDSFDSTGFWQHHLFNRGHTSWPDGFCDEMTRKMTAAAAMLPGIWQELPMAWLHQDADPGLPACLNFDEISRLLTRFQADPEAFWRLPK